MEATIIFYPTKETKGIKIGFIQSARAFDNASGKYIFGTTDNKNRQSGNVLPAGFLPAGGYFIDQESENPWPWYVLDKDGKEQIGAGRFGSSPTANSAGESAILRDAPNSQYGGSSYEFESAVVEKTGADPWKFYASLNWNIYVTASGTVSFYDIHSHDTPTKWWDGAVKAWNAQANSPKKVPDQHEIGPIK